jgi:SAM-dependent methyltransferase
VTVLVTTRRRRLGSVVVSAAGTSRRAVNLRRRANHNKPEILPVRNPGSPPDTDNGASPVHSASLIVVRSGHRVRDSTRRTLGGVSDTDAARSFGAVAQCYDRHRPGYAPAAVAWALGEHPVRVADLGAGTGILSRLLRRLGHEVIAIEPDEQMRARLVEVSPEVTTVAGRGEAIPLGDGSVDAVVAGQAYHWFKGDRAHAEVARVLRPGGVFAALWNDADSRTLWTVQFVEIIDGPQESRPVSDFGSAFGPVASAEFAHDVWLTADDLVALATTRSPYLVGTPAAREELLAAVRGLIAEHGLDRAGRFAMPHLTRVHRAHRR